MNNSKADEARERGNTSMSSNRPTEAFFYYTEAIKLNPADFRSYSNRSLAFLKIEQHFHALADAKKAIQLQPDWPKGYFRRGEVQFSTGNYQGAVKSYEEAVRLNNKDPKLQAALQKAREELKKTKSAEFRIPCICIAVGLLIGALIVLIDHFLTSKPSMESFILKSVFIVIFGMLGYGVSTIYFFVQKTYMDALIQPPIELKGDQKDKQQQQTEELLKMFNQPNTGASGKTNNSATTTKTTKTATPGGARQRKKTEKT